MKIKNTLVLLASGLFLLWACQPKQSAMHNNNLYQRQWMLVEFQNFSKDFLMKQQAELNLTETAEKKGKYTAYMGCNQLMVAGEIGNNRVKLEVMAATMSYCDGKMELEGKFISELQKMTSYKIEGHYLTLKDAQGNTMKFVAVDWD